MGSKRPWHKPFAPWLLLGLTAGVVDEAGRYRAGGDIADLAPPVPTEEDRNAAVDLSKQPIENIFKLLAYEILREERRPPERHFPIREFQSLTERACEERILSVADGARQVSEEVQTYHLNVTGTAGLFWLLHKYPEEHSWVWLIAVAHDRVVRKVAHHFARLSALVLADADSGCMSPGFRTALMSGVTNWKKLQGDYVALLWNGIAFGVLGDVTSWREMDEDGQTAEAGPGGPPPNVSWSENLIFANMWISSVQRWLEHHAQELTQGAYIEVARTQAGLPKEDYGQRWQHGADGVLSSFGFLHRQQWAGWELDKGLLRGFLRHCLQPGYGDSERVSVVDFGAGGGQYCEWLNDTGLVEAVALDATQAVQEITGGRVQELNLASKVELWQTFKWVLCLEVGGHMPPQQGRELLRNVRRHAEHGLVISWPTGRVGASLANPLNETDFVALVESETGLSFDPATTGMIRKGCEVSRLAETIAVFRRDSS